MSAPRAMSTLTTAGCFCATAHIRAVWPRVACALTLAPFAASSSTTSALPALAATISGVSPATSALFGLAPACSSRRVIAALRFWAASQSGVAPRSFAALGVGAGAQEHVGDLQLVAVARPVQRRRPVALGGLDVGFLLNEGANRRQISVASGGDERRGLGGRDLGSDQNDP